MRLLAPLANGIRTDHPVPGLSFVEDSLLDLTDPSSIEKIGRHHREGTWGRTDRYSMVPGAWRAFTTDPTNNEYAWVVIHHPENGTSVLLYRDDDAVAAYSYQDFINGGTIPLIQRKGGYWSDGDVWRRPTAVSDPITGERTWDEPPGASSMTALSAFNFLEPEGGGQVYSLEEFARLQVTHEAYPTWVTTSLATWAERRPEGSLPLGECVLDISAPELEQRALLDTAMVAEMAGVERATWRSYVSRGTSPEPQEGGTNRDRPYWSRPIIQAWVARRDREDSERAQAREGDAVTTSTLERISRSVARLGRRVLKADGAAAVRAVLQGQVIGVALRPDVSANMHAAWMLEEFSPGRGLSDVALDQIVSLIWLDSFSAERAMRKYVAQGVERGHSREEMEASLLEAPKMHQDVTGAKELILRAVRPRWE